LYSLAIITNPLLLYSFTCHLRPHVCHCMCANRRTILSTRAKTRTWAPWLARLHALLGLMAAGEGRVWVAHKLRAQKEAADRPAEAVSAGGGAAPGGGSRPGSRPTSPSPEAKAKGTPKKEEADKGKAKGGKKGADANADVTPPTPPPPPPLIALHHLAQAMQLACRHERWHEGLNAVRHMWNTVRALLNMDPSLMTATHRCEWQKGQMPPRPAPPAESLIAPAGAKDGKGGAKATPRKDDPKVCGCVGGREHLAAALPTGFHTVLSMSSLTCLVT
jgi:hypothetical protein